MPENLWSQEASSRKKIRRLYRRVWDIPVIAKKHLPIRNQLQPGMEVLDIGAAGKEFGRRVIEGIPEIRYRSMDIDRSHAHDFYSLDEVEGAYDLVLLMEIIEHIRLSEAEDLLSKVQGFLKPGGILAISTPNVYNPSLFLSDPTHCLFLSYESLGGLLLMTGYQVEEIYRTYSAAFLKRVTRRLASPLFRFLNLDYTRSILVLARRPE